MSKPTLREAVDVWLKQDFLPARQAYVVCHAIMDVARLYLACADRADTCSPADGSYEDGLRDWASHVSFRLDSIGIGTILELTKDKTPKFPQGPYWPILPRDNIKEGVQTVRGRFCHRGERPAQIKYDPDEDW